MTTVQDRILESREKEQQKPLRQPSRQMVKVKTNPIVEYLDRAQKKLALVASKQIDVKRLITHCCNLLNKNPSLLNCTPQSFYMAVYDASRLGLYPGGDREEATIIAYGKEAKLSISYHGYLELAYRNKDIKQISAEVVYEGDEFTYSFGETRKISHVPNVKLMNNDNRKIVCAYAIVLFTDGRTEFEVMSYKDIMKAREASKSSNSKAWANFEGEMCRKTVVKRLAKWLPKVKELTSAAIVDDSLEYGNDRPYVDLPDEDPRITVSETPVQTEEAVNGDANIQE